MGLPDFERCLSRAWSAVFERRKLLLTFAHLALSGVVFVVCRGLGLGAHSWACAGLTFLPIFISTGILLAGGVILVQLYRRELEGRRMQLVQLVVRSWDAVIGASYLAVPLVFVYLLLWISLGIFYLLLEIPAVGSAIGAVLAFAPFLLNLASVLLCIVCYFLLFFVTPALALGGKRRFQLIGRLIRRLRQRPIRACLAALLAMVPLLLTLGVLLVAVHLTGHAYLSGGAPPPLQRMLSWFFEMLPFCALLTPAVSFFYNFATEVYLLEEAMGEREVS